MKHIKSHNEFFDFTKAINKIGWGKLKSIPNEMIELIIEDLRDSNFKTTIIKQNNKEVTIKAEDDESEFKGGVFIDIILKNKLIFIFSAGGIKYINNDFDGKNWEDIDFSSFGHNVKYIYKRIDLKLKDKKEEENFYGQLSEVEVRDLVSDLSDLLGEYKLSKNNISKIGRCWFLEFNLNDLKTVIGGDSGIDLPLPNGTTFRTVGTQISCTIPSDHYLNIIKEIHSLNKRLVNGYNFRCAFDMNKTHLIIWIYKPKEE